MRSPNAVIAFEVGVDHVAKFADEPATQAEWDAWGYHLHSRADDCADAHCSRCMLLDPGTMFTGICECCNRMLSGLANAAGESAARHDFDCHAPLRQTQDTSGGDGDVVAYVSGAFESNASWEYWDWSSLTAVVNSKGNGSAVLCEAHRHGVRALVNIGASGKDSHPSIEAIAGWTNFTANLSSAAARGPAAFAVAAWVQAQGYDGVVLDVESNLESNRDALTDLTWRVRRALAVSNPNALLGFATSILGAHTGSKGAWPHFDLVAMSHAVDWFFVMAYGLDALDEGQQARANAGLLKVKAGIEAYLALGVPADKVVLGAPWYGFDNTCVIGTKPDSRVCIKADAARVVRSVLPYETYPAPSISEIIAQGLATTPVQFDEVQGSPWFNYVDNGAAATDAVMGGAVHQVWFDNPRSLSAKYELARTMGLRGVGAFKVDFADFAAATSDASRMCAAAMWSAFTNASAADTWPFCGAHSKNKSWVQPST